MGGSDFEGKINLFPMVANWNREKLRDASYEMSCLQPTFFVRESRTLADVVIPLNLKKNILNLLIPLDIMTNSNNCIQNKHDSCDGIVKTLIDGSDNTQMCSCQCHNSSYQMVQKMFGVINQKE
jgi:hypothetical protein